ncbi:glycosyltransferase family 4 protein [Polaribacter sargassicola]|uniref:glycosyltransferase family 4 protein n=1 Tax=Polaribacter sargassicola TaxID=2836891 RepID=UPI001F37BB10|nr:glycosyltransferase family 4 protein [Polaribacter sp. DS7-9]MCG1035720.1 glycosyltransferase family 4 protein [Polaribacter sp. DS7-9]
MSIKLNVLFLCGWYPSRVLKTNGDFIQRHAEAVSLNHNVIVLHIISDEKNVTDIEISTNVINGIETHIAYLKAVKNPLKKAYLFIKAFHLLIKKVGNFDVVHLNQLFPFGVFSLYLKWFQKKPYIISEHFTGYLRNSEFKINFFQKKITKCIVKNAYAVCSVSDYLSITMKELGFKGNYKTVPNVVNTNLFIPAKKEVTFLKIVHISSLKDDHKNIKGMLRVAKLLSEKLTYFEWKFIGNNGNEYNEYLNKLDIKNSKISFLEHISHSEIVSNLQEASLCISFSNYETFGIVITEAIACGTPVISTNTGIATSLKNLDFCKVIPIKNEQLLLESILNYKTIFANLDSYKMHLFVKHRFNKDVIANEFSSLYYKSLKK